MRDAMPERWQSGGQRRRQHETGGDHQADEDPEGAGAPGERVDRPERFLAVGVDVVTVVSAVIVGQVVGDGALVSGLVGRSVQVGALVGVHGPAFWQTLGRVAQPVDSPT